MVVERKHQRGESGGVHRDDVRRPETSRRGGRQGHENPTGSETSHGAHRKRRAAFNYGGFKNREIFNPNIPPNLTMTKEEYKKSDAPSINHFYEKLLLLKDLMNTETGKQLAIQRHVFMEQYLEQFYLEWNGEM